MDMKLPPLTKEALDRLEKLGKDLMRRKNVATRCNCDASCGENRYHDVGDSGCRFRSEDEYDSYWRNRTPEWAKERVVVPETFDMTVPKEGRKMSSGDTFEPDEVKTLFRPWGKWEVLNIGNGFKVKRLEILVDTSISMQYHVHRTEHWTIVQGTGKVIIDGNIFTVKKGDTFVVPKLAIHKVTNTDLKETLIAIEIQMGEICDETDIVRV